MKSTYVVYLRVQYSTLGTTGIAATNSTYSTVNEYIHTLLALQKQFSVPWKTKNTNIWAIRALQDTKTTPPATSKPSHTVHLTRLDSALLLSHPLYIITYTARSNSPEHSVHMLQA